MRIAIGALLLIVVASTALAGAVSATVTLDAANQDRHGTAFSGFAAVRPIIDNSAGAADLTGVRFKIEIHSGTLGGIGGWTWTNADNPWYGARAADALRPDGASYTQGIVYYPPTEDWAPAFFVDPTPGSPDSGDEYELFDTVPKGMVWDHPVKLSGWLGGDIDLFSTAGGDLTSDQLNAHVSDTDPGPQTVPEPAALSLLAIGAIGVIQRRVRRGR